MSELQEAESPAIPLAVESEESSIKPSKRPWALRTAEIAMVAYESSPFLIDDGLRYALLTGVYAATRSPELSAVAYAAATLGTETAAGVAAADLLASERGEKVVEKSNEVLEKLHISANAKVSKTAKAITSLYLGTPVYLGMKQREDPSRNLRENIRSGIRTASAIAGVCAVEGYALTSSANEVIRGVEKGAEQMRPEYALPAVAALGGLKILINRAKEKATKVKPRYDLSPKELKKLEKKLVDKAKATANGTGACAAWLPHDHPYANIIRTHEGSLFLDDGVNDFPEEAEAKTLQLALINTQPGNERVVHGATLMGPALNGNGRSVEELIDEEKTTGFETIDALVRHGNFTAEEFAQFYRSRGVDLEQCVSIETNFKIGENTELQNIPSAYLAYLLMFKRATRQTESGKIEGGVFASINEPSIKSFEKFGLKVEPLMGQEDLETPESKLGKEYKPVFIPPAPENCALFELLESNIELPQLVL
jgi:hypothetical protein